MKRIVIFHLIVILFYNCISKKNPVDSIDNIKSIIIQPETLVVVPQDSIIKFTANAITSTGDTLNDFDFTWISQDTSSVTIEKNGSAHCKNIGESWIYAKINLIESKKTHINVIPKVKEITSFKVGDKSGTEIKYVSFESGIKISYSDMSEYIIDIDNDSIDDFKFSLFTSDGNNGDFVHLISCFGDNKVLINYNYSATADSILFSIFDSSDTYNHPYFPDLFNNWVDTLSFGYNIINSSSWNKDGTFNYFYQRDASQYYSPDYGLFSTGKEKYIGLLFYNKYGYPIYCWLKVQFSRDLLLIEYAYSPNY